MKSNIRWYLFFIAMGAWQVAAAEDSYLGLHISRNGQVPKDCVRDINFPLGTGFSSSYIDVFDIKAQKSSRTMRFVTDYKCNGVFQLWLLRRVDSNGNAIDSNLGNFNDWKLIIKDVLVVPPLKQGQVFATIGCATTTPVVAAADEEISGEEVVFAIGKIIPFQTGGKLIDIQASWRVNVRTERFEKLDPRTISCESWD